MPLLCVEDLVKQPLFTSYCEFLQGRGLAHSAALAQLASRIAAVMRYGSGDGQDVFAKVKNVISDLIAKLEAEASS